MTTSSSSTGLRATLIDDRRLWNEFVANTPNGHLCQTWEWADNSGEATGVGSLRVGVLDGAGWLVAALLLVRSKATGMRAPFSSAFEARVWRNSWLRMRSEAASGVPYFSV